MDAQFQLAVRSLLLPTAPGSAAKIEKRIAAGLDRLKVPSEDHGRWLLAELRAWREAGHPSTELQRLVKPVLFDETRKPVSLAVTEFVLGADGMAEALRLLSAQYFNIHEKLVSEQFLGHNAAHQLLSHTGSILSLRLLDQMSASEIARWISSADGRRPISWKSIQTILADLKIAPQLSKTDLQSCFVADSLAEPDIFGDQNDDECIASISDIAKNLGVDGDFKSWLSDLTGANNHPPYLVILHYQLIIQEYFDHALSYLYEFTPRGDAVKALISNYVSAGMLNVQGNPFLNNAKAVERADFNWVIAKKDNKSAVRALSGILLSLEEVGFAVKSELSFSIRMFLCRLIRLRRESGSALLHRIPKLTPQSLESLLDVSSAGNSATTGILEQKLVEVWAASRHSSEWAPRGIGDSVFAANTFRRKFGDCEFELPIRPNPSIVAYEAHGGRLTEHYVADHLYTFGRVLAKRADLMTSISPLDQWVCEVIFVAHEIAGQLPKNAVIDAGSDGKLALNIKYVTFEEIASDLMGVGPDVVFDTLDTLNSRLVHPKVRKAIKGMMKKASAT